MGSSGIIGFVFLWLLLIEVVGDVDAGHVPGAALPSECCRYSQEAVLNDGDVGERYLLASKPFGIRVLCNNCRNCGVFCGDAFKFTQVLRAPKVSNDAVWQCRCCLCCSSLHV